MAEFSTSLKRSCMGQGVVKLNFFHCFLLNFVYNRCKNTIFSCNP